MGDLGFWGNLADHWIFCIGFILEFLNIDA